MWPDDALGWLQQVTGASVGPTGLIAGGTSGTATVPAQDRGFV